MKKLFVILALFAFACDVNKEDPEPVYTDIYGSWTFEHRLVTGTFNIVKGPDGKPYVDNVGGFFTIEKSGKIDIKEKYLVAMNGFKINQIVLKDDKVNSSIIEFYYSGEIASDYKTMSFTGFDYYSPTETDNIDEPLTMTRKID